MSKANTNKILDYVLQQVQADRQALNALPYTDWYDRVSKSVHSFIPDLITNAPDLIEAVQRTLNSPMLIREVWSKKIAPLLDNQKIPEELRKELVEDIFFITAELELEAKLITEITGETVSSLIADFLCEVAPDLAKNNRSTYPDLYFKGADYKILPQRTENNPSGPALKKIKPTSVPDGVEVKSQRGKSIRVDCHHPHQGIHLVVTFDRVNQHWNVYDVFVAYLSSADYKRARRNTTATTEKFSFGHTPFISALNGTVKNIAIEASPISDSAE
ncbi:MAG: hypothetical protein HY231_18165 [Acidobacteria bacterium]|nr:hypothetical protein [Acidobacteriota bacterium]